MTEPAAPPLSSEEAAAERQATRKLWLVRLALAVVGIALLWTLWYALIGRNSVFTDDAYVDAESAQVTPLTSASVVAVHVNDTQFVKAGSVLVELDPTDAKIALAQAQADLAEARRHFRQTLATGASLDAQLSARGDEITQAQAQLDSARATADKAHIDLTRREALAASGGVSGEELTNARRDNAAAQAELAGARAALAQAQSTRSSAQGQLAANKALTSGLTEDTDPGVAAAKARLDAAQLELDRMTIRAPMDGIVSQRRVQVGQRVAQGVAVMTIVPVGQVYVEANFKERQLRRVRPGMPAEVKADIYDGDVTYHGRVAGIAGATGAASAIIPAQNATGNWIKVVQRLPVRIDLDPKELAEHPLRVGLSTEVTIDITDH